jgi:cysteine-rich repeat protein
MPQCLRTLAITAAPIAALLLAATGSRADVDTNGRWVIRGSLIIAPYVVVEDWTQTGMAVTTSSGYSGTISPMTGAFSMTRPPSMIPCGTDMRSGTVSADGLSLTGTELIHPLFTPTTCIVGISLAITGSRCPSGTIEPGEGCDDGNTNNGDGCDNTCAVEPCWSCSGTPSVCAPLPAGTSCGDADGIDCTVDGTCDAAQHCVETPDSSLCDDENACTLEECDPIVGGCVFHDNPCDDGNPCTSDSCLGDCMHAPFIILDCKAAMSSTLGSKRAPTTN